MSGVASTEVGVFVHLATTAVRAGTAFVVLRRGTVTTTFVYDQAYLGRGDAWPISPDLPLDAGRGHTVGLPGAMADSAPDRWGRNLVAKTLRAARAAQGQTAATVTETDYLLGVSDLTRQGALRYVRADAPTFLAAGLDIPKLIELPRLLDAANAVSREDATHDDLAAVKILLDAGSGSLGGARPKASVRDGNRILIAKFPHPQDQWDVMAWEKTALDLASRCGIHVPARKLVDVTGRRVLLIERFDRRGAERVGYVSGMTMLRSRDGANHDYVELAEAMAEHGSTVERDLAEMWRRIAFSIAVNNTDDHMRNHGFLRQDGGWSLSPVFDVNPDPDPDAQRVTSIGYVTDRGAATQALTEAAPYFGVTARQASHIWDEVRQGVATWRDVAEMNGVAPGEAKQFADSLAP